MNSAAAYGASKQYVDIHTGTLEKVSWGAIEGDISNQADLQSVLATKKDTMKKMKQDFHSKWGSISLCSNIFTDFTPWFNWAWEKFSSEGDQEFFVPYAYNLMVQVFIDNESDLAIKWSMNNKWYAMSKTKGIIEIGEGDFVKNKLGSGNANKFLATNENGEVVPTNFDNQTIDCGTY